MKLPSQPAVRLFYGHVVVRGRETAACDSLCHFSEMLGEIRLVNARLGPRASDKIDVAGQASVPEQSVTIEPRPLLERRKQRFEQPSTALGETVVISVHAGPS